MTTLQDIGGIASADNNLCMLEGEKAQSIKWTTDAAIVPIICAFIYSTNCAVRIKYDSSFVHFNFLSKDERRHKITILRLCPL
jgi:hypothetical protein